jgi:hypothetical protein
MLVYKPGGWGQFDKNTGMRGKLPYTLTTISNSGSP